MDYEHIVRDYIDATNKSIINIDINVIIDAHECLITANNIGGKIFICGNGGSASTASHFQADLNMAFSVSKNMMPAFSLVNNIPELTAISNDFSFEDAFLYQLKFLLKKYDILIAISCSGNSINIINAVEYAKKNGNTIISLVGFDGGILKQISDICLHAKTENMQICEDIHLMFCHIVSTLIREGHCE